MLFSQSLLAGLVLIASAVAQEDTPIAFTSVPATVAAGNSYNISWGGGDDSPVTLTLRKGDPKDLATVGIIADRVEGYWYNWQVSNTLQTATYAVLSSCVHANTNTDLCGDFALQITQGQSDINYSGLFSITAVDSGNSTSSSNSTATATAAATHNSTMTSGTALPTDAAGNSTGIGSNATITRSGTLHTTAVVIVSLMRNSSYTGRTTTTTPATSLNTAAPTSKVATTSATATPHSTAGAVRFGSSIAMVLGVFGVVAFLN